MIIPFPSIPSNVPDSLAAVGQWATAFVTGLYNWAVALQNYIVPIADGPYTVATLPANPRVGTMARVIDSSVATWGTNVAGGGGNSVFVIWDGAHWTVYAI